VQMVAAEPREPADLRRPEIHAYFDDGSALVRLRAAW
jgi:hypothetical protein